MLTAEASDEAARCELYRALGEPIRIRLLALVAEEELAIGELSLLAHESQPNVSRHIGVLRQAQLVRIKKQGTRSLVTLQPGVVADVVVADAIASGRAMCHRDGTLARVAMIVAERDAATRDYFATLRNEAEAPAPHEHPPYLAALTMLLPRHALAIDAGTGDGALLELLAPGFSRVIGLDRSEAQLNRARARVATRGWRHVELLVHDLETAPDAPWHGTADVVFAARVLHHAAVPRKLMSQLAAMLAPGGRLCVIDYGTHHDEAMRHHADHWLGFDPAELCDMAQASGLTAPRVAAVPPPTRGPDAHLPWQVLVATKA